MIRFPKAATFAAVSVALASTAIFSQAGFAYRADASSSALADDSITIDPVIIEADQAIIDAAQTESKNNNNSAIIFTSGTGDDAPMAVPTDANKSNESENAQKPVVAAITASSLAALVRAQDVSGTLDSEGHCLAGAVYFESKGETLPGQLAVARVVMARAKSGRFPASLCGVVFQKSQFSFVRGSRMPAIDTGSQNWRNAVAISKIALNSTWKSPVEGALFFHARYVSPGWRLTRLGTIDNHIFYR
jgi:spore germination cell wall hydrolase CwlJ-like protein